VTVFALAPGLRLQQRYVLRAPLGSGGMSEVWRADDEVLRRPVAVKALTPDLAADPGLRAGVRHEARTVASLDHPHITRVYDHGEAALPDGSVVSYLVMELVDGLSLAARLTDGPLPWPEAARVAVQVAGALAAAHRAGLVHRDVKPANVMLTTAGAKVLDFGIAALAGPPAAVTGPAAAAVTGPAAAAVTGPAAAAVTGPAATAVTGPAAAARPPDPPGVGTPAYAAPEWLTGAPPHPAADVYGIGALLFECLTGQPAVHARTWPEAAAIHRRAVPAQPPEAPGLPARIGALCVACLSPDPRDRPSAAAVAATLGRPRPGVAPRRRLRTTLVRRETDADGDRTGRIRPVGVALLCAAAAGVLALTLTVAAALDRPAGRPDAVAGPPAADTSAAEPVDPVGPAGPGDQATAGGDGAPPTRPPAAPPQPTGPPAAPAGQPAPAAVVDEFERRLSQAAAAGRVRADVAVDLRNGLNDLRDRISHGGQGDLRQRAADLRRKLAERLAERAIDARTAAQLTDLLDPLL
jgi:serine/threonine-protein kinase